MNKIIIPNIKEKKEKIFDLLGLEQNDHYISYVEYMQECDKDTSEEVCKDFYLNHSWEIDDIDGLCLVDKDEGCVIASIENHEFNFIISIILK